MNLDNECPFKDLEINILIDCARTINDNDKFFTMIEICGLTTAFNYLEIPYLISVIGDSGFKIILKDFEEPHNELSLQKTLDCIFIKRAYTNIASCLKVAIDKFPKGNNKQRVFYIFTNGFDEEYGLYKQWKKNIFNDKNSSFCFIISKSNSLEDEQHKFLSEFWLKFKKNWIDLQLNFQLIETTTNKIKDMLLGKNNEFIKEYISSITSVLRRINYENNISEYNIPSYELELNNFPKIDNLKSIVRNKILEEIKDIYIQKEDIIPQKTPPPKINQNEYKLIYQNIGKIIKTVNEIPEEYRNETKKFVRDYFKVKKEKIDISLLNKIFIPNMPTQTILTDVGSNLDVIELIKFFLNPTPNPKIYRELGDGLIKNYGVTVLIDSSNSCFGGVSLIHSLQTIKMLLNSLNSIDLPCFDLIIATESKPIIICNERNTFEILSDNSQIWPILFSLISRKVSNIDLSSAIHSAFNLHNYRRNEHTDYLFVLTDGLFSKSQRQKITDNIHYCISRGMKVFGIGLGICPYGIEKLFPNVIYSKNPMKLIEGISECCFGNFNKDEMNGIYLNPEFVIYENDIKECMENPKYLSLKKELINIIIELSGYDFYQGEIPKDAKEEDMEVNGIYSIHQFGMYPKNFFKGQKILFVMPYSCEMNNKENKAFSYKYIREKYKNESNYECIKSSLEYTGIDVDYVINYKDAIMKLTTSTQREGYCDYFACAILSGPPYAQLPNPNDDPYLLGQFLKVIKNFGIMEEV